MNAFVSFDSSQDEFIGRLGARLSSVDITPNTFNLQRTLEVQENARLFLSRYNPVFIVISHEYLNTRWFETERKALLKWQEDSAENCLLFIKVDDAIMPSDLQNRSFVDFNNRDFDTAFNELIQAVYQHGDGIVKVESNLRDGQEEYSFVIGTRRCTDGEGVSISKRPDSEFVARMKQNTNVNLGLIPLPEYTVIVNDLTLWSSITVHSQKSISLTIQSLVGIGVFADCEIEHNMTVQRKNNREKKFDTASIELYFDRNTGIKPFSGDILRYCNLLAGLIEESGEYGFEFRPSSMSALIYKMSNEEDEDGNHEDSNLSTRCDELEHSFVSWHKYAMAELEVEFSKAVTLRFDFPDELRTPCEQYLLYFAEFLKDAGVNATANLNHDTTSAKQVLFTVTPDDPDAALDKIREALAIYLRLPTAPMSSMPVGGLGGAPGLMPTTPFEVQKLVYAVQNFQTQLTMANMMLMNQQATIQAQQTAIGVYQQQASMQPFTGEVLANSVQAASGSDTSGDAEKILGGIVELGKAEKYGVAVNLGEAFRKVKGLLSKKQDGQP